MPLERPFFPLSLWDGLTRNRNRVNLDSVLPANWADWDRIAAEVIAMQDTTAEGSEVLLDTITSDTTLNTTISAVVLVDASAGDVTITLPKLANFNGRYEIKRIDLSANVVTVKADGSETIDGVNSHDILTQYGSLTVKSVITMWIIL